VILNLKNVFSFFIKIQLDDEGDDGVGVQALQEHEHEADREEEVDQDRLDPAKLKTDPARIRKL
jgi:hypothetical protein